jgi:hypothetical protein
VKDNLLFTKMIVNEQVEDSQQTGSNPGNY